MNNYTEAKLIGFDAILTTLDTENFDSDMYLFNTIKKMDKLVVGFSPLVPEYAADIDALGFDFKINGSVAEILAIPDAIGSADAETLFAKIADELARGSGNPQLTEAIRREKALYQIACKAAIKGGRKYDRAILDWLIEKVLSMPDVIVCPHGRPIAYRLTKNELDKQFSRIK